MSHLLALLALLEGHCHALRAAHVSKPAARSAALGRRAALQAGASLTLLSRPPAATASLVRDGMAAFASGKIDESIELYDRVLRAQPEMRPYLWQRGLSLFYADRFVEGAAQFADDVSVNPNDTEEQLWHLLCLARVDGRGLAKARAARLQVGRDRRPVMRAVQALFLDGGASSLRALTELAENGDASERFYAALYLGLYFEAEGAPPGEARRWVRAAVASRYAGAAGAADPMVDLAKVHLKLRGWS